MKSHAVPVVVMLLVSGLVCAEPLGRLFYTPAQRAQLDGERNRPNPVVVPEAPAEPVRVPPALTYSGVVQRSDGKATVWINNQIAPQGEALSGIAVVGRVGRDGKVRLRFPQNNAAVDLKVGQTFEVDSGTVAEGYARPQPPAISDVKPATREDNTPSDAMKNPRRRSAWREDDQPVGEDSGSRLDRVRSAVSREWKRSR